MKYEAIAPIYDKIMRHVEYNEWADLINKISSQYFSNGKPKIFEIGGGTGTLGTVLKEYGYSYSGSDYSYSMCVEANKKGMNFVCADCRHLPIKSKSDLVIFLYDGINYLHNISDYKLLFEQVSMCLNDGGYFLFDITTETNSLRYFTDFVDYEDYGDYFYLRNSYYNKGTSKQHNDFTVFKKKNNCKEYIKYEEHHIQKIFSPELIKKTIKSSDFTAVGIWDDFSFFKYSSKSERIHFLLRKN